MTDIILPGESTADGKFADSVYFQVHNNGRKYFPQNGDLVVGIVKMRMADYYLVDIGAQADALLECAAFPQATKRNKPNLSMGDVVYCMVIRSDKDSDFEVTCALPEDKQGWTTGGNYLGELKGGFISNVTTCFAKKLMQADDYLTARIGQTIAYQIAIGVNGRIWIESGDNITMIKLKNAIEAAEHLSQDAEYEIIIKTIFRVGEAQ